MVVLEKIKNFLAEAKTWLKTFKLPSLLSFVTTKDGELNPDPIEILKDAQDDPKKETLWQKFSVKTTLGVTSGTLVLIVIGLVALEYFGAGLKFLIDIVTKGAVVVALGYVLYLIYNSFKK